MSYYSVASPYQIFLDDDGKPLENGYIYIGQANQNPITNPINISWDNAGLYSVAQPIRTLSGYPNRQGKIGEIYINSLDYQNYSITVLNKHQELVYSSIDERRDIYDNYVYSEADLLAFDSAGRDAVLGADITLTGDYTPNIHIDTNGYQIDGVWTIDFTTHQPKALTNECFGASITVTGLAEPMMEYWTTNAVPRTTSMTSALIKALACADASDSYVKVNAGEYLLDGTIDLTGVSKVNIVGVYRESIFRIDYGGTAVFDLTNAGPSFFRGHKFMGLTFGLNSAGASVPNHIIYSDYTPEFFVFECMVINCTSVSQLRLSNTFVCHIAHSIFIGDENLTGTDYGDFPQSGSAGGTCIHLEAENHNSTIRNCRIRASDGGATSAGVKLGSGDGIKIADNAIESNRNWGIAVLGSLSQLTIDNNYFEGGSQPIDVYYSSAGTNFGHTIFRNWFNAVQAVEVDGAQINDMRIINNTFDSQALAVNILGTSNKNGLMIKDNLHRDQIGAQLPWNIAEFPTALTSIVEPDIEIQDRFVGTGRIAANDLYPFSKTSLAQNNSWQTYSGSGTAVNSSIYPAGLQGYDISSVDTSYVGITCQGYDNSWRDKYITVFVNLATSDSRSQTVGLDFDASITYTFSCSTEPNGRMIRIQRKIPSGATRFYVKFLVGPALTTLTTIVPTVYFGLHSTPEYYEWR